MKQKDIFSFISTKFPLIFLLSLLVSPGNEMLIIWHAVKGTLMQIWNLPICLCSEKKQYSKKFALLTLRLFELFAREVCKFLKK